MGAIVLRNEYYIYKDQMDKSQIEELISILSQDTEYFSSSEIDKIDKLVKNIAILLPEDYSDFIQSRPLYSREELKSSYTDDLPF